MIFLLNSRIGPDIQYLNPSSSYNEHFLTASIGWRVFVSATWGIFGKVRV
jgi:hypothetical protein